VRRRTRLGGCLAAVAILLVPACPVRADLIVPRSDGQAWVVTQGDDFFDPGPRDAVYLVDANGNRRAVSGFFNHFTYRPWTATVTSDNALWVVEYGTIGRMGFDGEVREYALPSRGSRLAGGDIVSGRDDSLWITESGEPGHITHITQDGTATVLPSSSYYLKGQTYEDGTPVEVFVNGGTSIARASDGRIWFASQDTDGESSMFTPNLARVSTTGEIESMRSNTLPSARHYVSCDAVTPSDDGAVWCDDSGGLREAPTLVLADGRMRSFTLPPGVVMRVIGGEPTVPDGSLWFPGLPHGSETPTAWFSISRTGRIERHHVGINLKGGLGAMAIGPDGAFWISDQSTPPGVARLPSPPVGKFMANTGWTDPREDQSTEGATGPRDAPGPKVSHVTLSRTLLIRSRRSSYFTKLRFRLDRPCAVSVALYLQQSRSRSKIIRRSDLHRTRGVSTYKVRTRGLRPGPYVLLLTPRDQIGHLGSTRQIGFRVARAAAPTPRRHRKPTAPPAPRQPAHRALSSRALTTSDR
jgi:streptogramin lyase